MDGCIGIALQIRPGPSLALQSYVLIPLFVASTTEMPVQATPSSPPGMSTTSDTGRSTRSRTGCRECRKASQKCDEVRPICSRCQRLKRSCHYTRPLTWKPKHARVSVSVRPCRQDGAAEDPGSNSQTVSSENIGTLHAGATTANLGEKLSFATGRPAHKPRKNTL